MAIEKVFIVKINLTREDETEKENYIKIEKRTFRSQQRVKIKFILKKHLLYESKRKGKERTEKLMNF